MRKIVIAGLLLLLIVGITPPAFAADFNGTYIRLDKMTENTSPGRVLVTANTNVADVEDAVRVIAGSGWSISGTASNFTTSTTGLPDGVSAWPGIGTASAVSGQTITFPSSNLTANTVYGFYITGGFTTNPGAGSGSGHLWQVITRVGGTNSSEATLSVPTIVNDSISVTATVEANSNDLQVTLTEDNSTSSVEEEQTLNYTITYGSTLPYDAAITVRASWSEGTLSDSSQSGINILSYVTNSASNAYNSTAPVIDLSNRTITWSIPSLPSNTTNQTVTFQLKTTSAYTGALGVNFSVKGAIISPATKESTLNHTYSYSTPITSTPTSIPETGTGPTATSVPTATATPAPGLLSCNTTCTLDAQCDSGYCHPTEKLCRLATNPSNQNCQTSPISLETLEPTTLQSDTAEFDAQFNQPTIVNIYFGTDPNELELYKTLPLAQRHRLTFGNLLPETTYYFRIDATDEFGNIYQSDLFTFTTPASVEKVVLPSQVLFTSNGILISSGSTAKPLIFHLPTNLPLESTLFFDEVSTLSTITFYAQDNNQRSFFLGRLTPSTNQSFSGGLILPSVLQEMTIMVRIENIYGAFQQLPLAQLRKVTPFSIRDASTQAPIERASVLIKRKHPITQVYELITTLTTNPILTNHSGQLQLYLNDGEYSVEISADGYQRKTLFFPIESNALNEYPQVQLERSPLFFLTRLGYHFTSLQTIIEKIQQLIFTFAQSPAVLQVIGISSLFIFSLLTTSSFIFKTHTSWETIKSSVDFYNKFHRNSLFAKHNFTLGKVIHSKTKSPVSGANITIVNIKTGKTVWTGKTDHLGIFKFSSPNKDELRLTISSPELLPLERTITPSDKQTQALTFELEDHPELLSIVTKRTFFTAKHVLGQLFESFLILSFLTVLIAFQFFPASEVLPFFALTTINLALWLQHAYSAMLHGMHLLK